MRSDKAEEARRKRERAKAIQFYFVWHQMFRMEGMGVSEEEMAKRIGYSTRQVMAWRASSAYQEMLIAKLERRVSAMDVHFAQEDDLMFRKFRELVPACIGLLEEQLLGRNMKLAMQAASEILDRDERFRKTVEVNQTHQLLPAADVEKARQIAREFKFVHALPEPKPRGADIIEAEVIGERVEPVDGARRAG
jgi:hypothetical protein